MPVTLPRSVFLDHVGHALIRQPPTDADAAKYCAGLNAENGDGYCSTSIAGAGSAVVSDAGSVASAAGMGASGSIGGADSAIVSDAGSSA